MKSATFDLDYIITFFRTGQLVSHLSRILKNLIITLLFSQSADPVNIPTHSKHTTFLVEDQTVLFTPLYRFNLGDILWPRGLGIIRSQYSAQLNFLILLVFILTYIIILILLLNLPENLFGSVPILTVVLVA